MSPKTSDSRPRASWVCLVFVAVSLTSAASHGSASASAQSAKANDGWVLAVPKRRAADAPPAAPPPLPAGAKDVKPATIDIVIRREMKPGGVHTLRQTVSRTSEQIHIAGNDKREWLFDRNPIDPRRVSATLIDHAAPAIILYGETDLRMVLGIRGWTDVLALGFDSQLLSGYTRTRDVRTIGGIPFARYATNQKGGTIDELWWSEEQVLASRFTSADKDGFKRFSIERIRAGVDATFLRPAETRFPTYRVFDLASWLERH